MNMTRIALLAAASAAVLVPAATAEAQSQNYYRSVQECEAARQNRQVAGAVIGAILGGVIAAQIEDDIDDRDNRNWRGRHHGYDGYYGRHRGYRGYDRGNENDVAVAAGAGLGGLLGYGVAGGEPCAPIYRNNDNRYYGGYDNGGYYDDNRYAQGGYRDDQGYTNSGYYDENGNYYADDSYYVGDEGTYADQQRYYGNGELAGGPDGYVYSQPSTQARVYTAGANNNCRWMQTRRADAYGTVSSQSVWMCQGSDGIWRPAQ